MTGTGTGIDQVRRTQAAVESVGLVPRRMPEATGRGDGELGAVADVEQPGAAEGPHEAAEIPAVSGVDAEAGLVGVGGVEEQGEAPTWAWARSREGADGDGGSQVPAERGVGVDHGRECIGGLDEVGFLLAYRPAVRSSRLLHHGAPVLTV